MEPIEDIYRRYGQTVYRYLLSLTREPDTAEELTQETFCQAIRSIDRYDGTCRSPRGCAPLPATSLWRGEGSIRRRPAWRRERIRRPSAEAEALASAERRELLKKLHGCPEPYREVLYLRWLGGLSFREIGEICGKTENWARVTAYRGKERLRKELEEHE